MSAPLALLGIYVWGRLEQCAFRQNLASYKPLPIPSTCCYSSNQVSVVICTVDTLLARCLKSWLSNNPLEIIIITIPEHVEKIRSVILNAITSPEDFAKINLLVSPEKGKRAQLSVGLRAARGEVLALVDDHIMWHTDFLKGMLPCLEDESVGAVGPMIIPMIPHERQDVNVITPWEVAAMRTAWWRNRHLKAGYAANRWCFCLAGCSGVFRAEILKDPCFLNAFNMDSWMGHKLDVGEDTFITRWLHLYGWAINIQHLPETEVYRTSKKDSNYLKQMFRWERSTIQSHIRYAFQVKQIYSSFFVARTIWLRLLRPLITTIHGVIWALTMWQCPLFALLIFALYVIEAYPTYKEFFDEYPYMRRYWWAVVGQEFFYIIQDFWGWWTLTDTSWEPRKVTAEDQNMVN